MISEVDNLLKGTVEQTTDLKAIGMNETAVYPETGEAPLSKQSAFEAPAMNSVAPAVEPGPVPAEAPASLSVEAPAPEPTLEPVMPLTPEAVDMPTLDNPVSEGVPSLTNPTEELPTMGVSDLSLPPVEPSLEPAATVENPSMQAVESVAPAGDFLSQVPVEPSLDGGIAPVQMEAESAPLTDMPNIEGAEISSVVENPAPLTESPADVNEPQGLESLVGDFQGLNPNPFSVTKESEPEPVASEVVEEAPVELPPAVDTVAVEPSMNDVDALFQQPEVVVPESPLPENPLPVNPLPENPLPAFDNSSITIEDLMVLKDQINECIDKLIEKKNNVDVSFSETVGEPENVGMHL